MNGVLVPVDPMVWTPFGWVPLATGPTFSPGTLIKIEVPITNNSNETFNTRIRVKIYQGSILPGAGDLVRVIDSAWLMLAVGQTRNFSTGEFNTIKTPAERRDVNIEVQYLDAGRVLSGGSQEWDDLYWVKEVIEFAIGTPTVAAV